MADFEQLVLSGGGCRCFWQGGFLHVVQNELPLSPARVTGVSGGALTLAGFLAGRGERVLAEMKEAFRSTGSNINWHHPSEAGLTPHQTVYEEVVTRSLDGDAMSRVAAGPQAQILLGHPPSDRWARLTGSLATLAYETELHMVGSPHFNWAERLGVSSSLVDARAAAQEGKLAALVRFAATIPPVFAPPRWNGRAVIDGGMADQAPMPDPDKGRTLVLLTRPYKRLPEVAGRLYVWPEEEVPADKIDFTDPEKIQATWDAGLTAGEKFLRERAAGVIPDAAD
ncbi:patatin-like phospholipase family protein [Leisingera sp. MMG026]|uniref:patatin-like phospholipase family protein n=1 Tax=Leisingera sp. MMG026 TaxID=2909982 RepID=UPI001F1EA6CA|nr:patatin-like phospholipase family protein [Leisingera sp. MMG026]MCF6430495.1 patatin-like phospholipase family protein [Leisingera sp. MMG026]